MKQLKDFPETVELDSCLNYKSVIFTHDGINYVYRPFGDSHRIFGAETFPFHQTGENRIITRQALTEVGVPLLIKPKNAPLISEGITSYFFSRVIASIGANPTSTSSVDMDDCDIAESAGERVYEDIDHMCKALGIDTHQTIANLNKLVFQ